MDGSIISIDQMVRQLRRIRSQLACSDDALLELYWRFHPRFRFLKTAKADAKLLDIGAGSGGMGNWLKWGEPKRDDVSLYGVDLVRGVDAWLYRGWEDIDLDATMLRFPGVIFDACVLSHVIEHVRELRRLLAWLASRLPPEAPIYIEWPSEESARLPGREMLLPHGVDITITNFFDDASHLRMIPAAELTAWLSEAGFYVREAGVVDLGIIGEEMLARGLLENDALCKLSGFWSITGWANWIVAARGPS